MRTYCNIPSAVVKKIVWLLQNQPDDDCIKVGNQLGHELKVMSAKTGDFEIDLEMIGGDTYELTPRCPHCEKPLRFWKQAKGGSLYKCTTKDCPGLANVE